MLTSWRVGNFKSISDPIEIPLSAVNVLAGANSSGKSTLIQSLLLMKQTAQASAYNRPLVLNGPILRLGNFEDIKNATTQAEDFSIGWTFKPSPKVNYRRVGTSPFSGVPASFLAGRSGISQISADFTWTATQLSDLPLEPPPPSEDVLKLHPKLHSTTVTIEKIDKDPKFRPDASIKIRKSDINPDDRFASLGLIAGYKSVLREQLQYEVAELDMVSGRELIGPRPQAEIVGVSFHHFWPSFFAITFNAARLQASKIAEAICSPQSLLSRTSDVFGEEVPKVVLNIIADWLEERGATPSEVTLFREVGTEDLTVSTINSQLQPFRSGIIGLLSHSSADSSKNRFDFSVLQERIESQMLSELGDESVDIEFETHRSLSEAGELVHSYFAHFVRYLGPLRDEPRPIYPRETLGDPTDVGYKGELTAAVLDLNAQRQVLYISPKSLGTGKAPKPTRATLHQAVVEWLTYFGMAAEVETEDRGKFGHQLQVYTDVNQKPHDLTHVGVGVSQVLPILVSSILAPKFSMMVFEQPELHLHPKVQARIADFFMSFAYLDKQCILETHSEYLVERLRLRIAESLNSEATKHVNVYFTKKDASGTSFRKVKISDYGSVIEWPDDFFDQSQLETERILIAASQKLAKEKALKAK